MTTLFEQQGGQYELKLHLDIYFTAIGLFDIPTEQELLRTVEKLQEQKQTISKSV